jgi:hypothetical protein
MSRIYGNPDSVQQLGDQLRTAGNLTGQMSDRVRARVGALVPASWSGAAADSFVVHMDGERALFGDLAQSVGTASGPLEELAGGLRRAQQQLREAQAVGAGNGFAVDEDGNITDLEPHLVALATDAAEASRLAAQRAQQRRQVEDLVEQARRTGDQARSAAHASLGGVYVPQIDSHLLGMGAAEGDRVSTAQASAAVSDTSAAQADSQPVLTRAAPVAGAALREERLRGSRSKFPEPTSPWYPDGA